MTTSTFTEVDLLELRAYIDGSEVGNAQFLASAVADFIDELVAGGERDIAVVVMGMLRRLRDQRPDRPDPGSTAGNYAT